MDDKEKSDWIFLYWDEPTYKKEEDITEGDDLVEQQRNKDDLH